MQPSLRPRTHCALAARQEERDGWHAVLARHQACLTPHAWHTLDETLSELPSADIAVRDGMTVPHARHRSERLLRFVRSHLVHGETTCHEERL